MRLTEIQWSIQNKGDLHGPSARCVITDSEGLEIATISGLTEHSYNHARLITAAPRLLEATKALAAQLEASGEPWMDNPAWRLARAAIDKAESNQETT